MSTKYRLPEVLKRTMLYKHFRYYQTGRRLLEDPEYISTVEKTKNELQKRPTRTEVINFLLDFLDRETTYLEIGVRDPNDNFNQVRATDKYSVDPGLEYLPNPVSFKMNSDDFFRYLSKGKILNHDTRFDLIFLDGLHHAEQADRDIANALSFVRDDGFVLIHDCNPPTEWHARENYSFKLSPAQGYWSGTTWKAFLKWRSNPSVFSCCIDSDWGIGVLSNKTEISNWTANSYSQNNFYEFSEFEKNKSILLNLLSFNNFKESLIGLS